MSTGGSLDAWRKAFRALDAACPWPGPRPLVTEHDRVHNSHLLAGRDDVRREFRQEVDEHRLVLLTGASGVGKTSLLHAGFIPALQAEDAGYLVAACRDWRGRGGEQDPAVFLAEKIAAALPPELDLPPGADLFWQLERDYGRRAVIILDQFEELIRFSPRLTERVFNLLVDINHETNLKVVVSFRSEFLHDMRPLQTRAKPFQLSEFRLDEIEADRVIDVVLAPNRDGVDAIDLKAAEALAGAWAAVNDPEHGQAAQEDAPRVGLLNLQAVLYTLHSMAAGHRVEVGHVLELAGVDDVERVADVASELFDAGLSRSIDVKLERCRLAATEAEIDGYLTEGAAHVLARSVRHLSSAGFKLVREVNDLLHSAIGDEVDVLTRGAIVAGEPDDGPLPRRAVDDLLHLFVDQLVAEDEEDHFDVVAVSRAEVARVLEKRHPGTGWSARLHEGEPAQDADEAEVACGPMMGMAPVAVLIEELRRFVLALAWLEESALARVTTPGSQRAMVSLIHDGFGHALETWSEKTANDQRGPLHAITAPQAASYFWSEPTTGLLLNLRWKGAGVGATFRDVVFVNCDFRGSLFLRCRFEGVSFVNCRLDGTMFWKCTFAGAQELASGRSDDDQPTFEIDDPPPALLESLRHYRGGSGDRLLAPVPNDPAEVVAEVPDDVMPWTRVGGGAAFYGGRLSALVVRDCAFEDEGRLSLRHVAGSGLELVEQQAGSIEIFGSAVRHVTFSGGGHQEGTLDVTATDSALAQLWIGEGLSGTCTIVNCRLVQAWNASDVVATVERSTVHGLVGFDAPEPVVAMGGVVALARPDELDPDGVFAERGSRMDYVSNPAAT